MRRESDMRTGTEGGRMPSPGLGVPPMGRCDECGKRVTVRARGKVRRGPLRGLNGMRCLECKGGAA